jgi:hypothetical protein
MFEAVERELWKVDRVTTISWLRRKAKRNLSINVIIKGLFSGECFVSCLQFAINWWNSVVPLHLTTIYKPLELHHQIFKSISSNSSQLSLGHFILQWAVEKPKNFDRLSQGFSDRNCLVHHVVCHLDR